MKVLITGGAGYIGSVVAAQLAAEGSEVVVFDNLAKGHAQAVKSARLIEGDLGDIALLNRTFESEKFDAVMHFAAWIEVGESMAAPAKYFRNNTANALNLLEAMVAQGVRAFVFSSTAAVYGTPERVPIEETDRLQPQNAYGESKLMVERMLAWFHRIHGISACSLRYFNAAGATETLGEHHSPESHLIPLILQVAAGKRPHIAVYGNDYPTTDGTCVRDYIHVADLSQAHVLAVRALLENKEPRNLAYNLGNGKGFTVNEVIEAARKVTGHKIPAAVTERRAGDPPALVASSERIRRELGWKPQFPDLESIIGSAWRWMQKHPNGYE